MRYLHCRLFLPPRVSSLLPHPCKTRLPVVLSPPQVSQETNDDGRDGSRVRFEVRDTGRGLKTSVPSTLFSRYTAGGLSPCSSPNGWGAPESRAGQLERRPTNEPTEESIEAARSELEAKLSFSADKSTGLGIGLNLTYGLVRAMGGELRAESTPGNTCFWFVLPAIDAHTPDPDERYVAPGVSPGPADPGRVVTPTRPKLSEMARAELAEKSSSRNRCKARWSSISSMGGSSSTLGDALSRGETPGNEAPCGEALPVTTSRTWQENTPVKKLIQAADIAGQGLGALNAPHILVVEDTDACAMIICLLVKSLGCSTDRAVNGAEALEILRNAEPGLYSMILMDLRMPVMDGFEATKAIREMGLPVPVVALTADQCFNTRDQCFAIGFDDFVTKPLHRDHLAEIVHKHTGHQVCEAAAAAAASSAGAPPIAT